MSDVVRKIYFKKETKRNSSEQKYVKSDLDGLTSRLNMTEERTLPTGEHREKQITLCGTFHTETNKGRISLIL